MKPIIGITSGNARDGDELRDLGQASISCTRTSLAVIRAGGSPIILPPNPGFESNALSLVDGLIFSDGPDLDPKITVGDLRRGPDYFPIEDRDDFEIALAILAWAADIPVFGIGRGIQVLNVALGGTVSDLASESPTLFQHHQPMFGNDVQSPSFDVTIAPESGLSTVYGASKIKTNSLHRNYLQQLSNHFTAVAFSVGGIVEAIESSDRTCFFAVQWLPQMMSSTSDANSAPFQILVGYASSKRTEIADAWAVAANHINEEKKRSTERAQLDSISMTLSLATGLLTSAAISTIGNYVVARLKYELRHSRENDQKRLDNSKKSAYEYQVTIWTKRLNDERYRLHEHIDRLPGAWTHNRDYVEFEMLSDRNLRSEEPLSPESVEWYCRTRLGLQRDPDLCILFRIHRFGLSREILPGESPQLTIRMVDELNDRWMEAANVGTVYQVRDLPGEFEIRNSILGSYRHQLTERIDYPAPRADPNREITVYRLDRYAQQYRDFRNEVLANNDESQ